VVLVGFDEMGYKITQQHANQHHSKDSPASAIVDPITMVPEFGESNIPHTRKHLFSHTYLAID